VLRAGWIPACRQSQIAAPGDYVAVDLLGEPLVAVRDEGGTVRVLSRVCRHRGFLVVEGAGNTRSFACPYHIWRYGLDGALLSAPAMEQSAAFDRKACALPSHKTETWGGWVFVNLSGHAAPLGPQLAALDARLAPIDPSDLVTADIVTFESPWNWKVMVENFMESYHHIGPHSGTLQHTNPGLGTWVRDVGDAAAVLENPALEGHNPFVVAMVFPLTMMFVTEGPVKLGAWYEMTDLRVDRFRLNIHLLAPPDFAAVPAMVEAFRGQVNAIHLEDIPACEGVQKGVTSPHYQPGPLSHLEAALWRFHRHLQSAVRGALER
jgi:phenylpropionate dioxygenase-like ring-hydroxylating dioxygenase large terminal subunit